MYMYAFRRVAQLVFVFFGVTLVVFVVVFSLPADPIQNLSPGRPLPPETVAQLRAHYHLDDPFLAQYWSYIGGVLHGDLGTDYFGRPVTELMGQRWPVTIKLAATAIVFEIVFGIGLGLLAALRHQRITDRAILFFTIAVISTPAFVLGYVAQLLFGIKWHIAPVAGVTDGWPTSYVVPALILGAWGLASVTRLVRGSVLENLRADYVRTAYAKGLSSQRVVVRHVLRNSLIPVVTFLALDFGFMIGGAVVIEGIFNLPGVGQLLFSALKQQAGPVIIGVSTALVLIFLVLNLIVDLLYGVLDPRIRLD